MEVSRYRRYREKSVFWRYRGIVGIVKKMCFGGIEVSKVPKKICVFFSIPVSKVSKDRTYNLCIFLDTGIEGIEGIEENLCIFLDTAIEGIEGIGENMCIYLDTGIEGIEGPNLLIYVFSRYRYRRYRAC